jgi:predicted RNA-binding protein Jag
MKSMLHEASTVVKAIEKAWNESGNPREFTINIHEKGEKGFLGFSIKPAIVSITYNPNEVPARHHDKNNRPANPQNRDARGVQVKQRDDQRNAKVGQPLSKNAQPLQKNSRPVVAPAPKPQPTLKAELNLTPVNQQPVEPKKRPVAFEDEIWSQTLVGDMDGWFKDVLATMNPELPYSLKADKKMLYVSFDGPLLPAAEDQRPLFASLAYLSIQFLKKKHKKKLRGFHVIINESKANSINEPSSAS